MDNLDSILDYTPMYPGIDPTYGCEPSLRNMVELYYVSRQMPKEDAEIYLNILKAAFKNG